MSIASHFDLFTQSQKFSVLTRAEDIINHLEFTLRPFGITHFMVIALPMPGRSVDTILRREWPNNSSHEFSMLQSVNAEDPIINLSIDSRGPFCVGLEDMVGDKVHPSDLFFAAMTKGDDTQLISIPIHNFHPFQGAVIMAGPNLNLDRYTLLSMEFFCATAFERLIAVGGVCVDRPGGLSQRERRVIELTAMGQTAQEIAEALDISQRTVHAHLQNVGYKLRAKNKTHAVMQAIRYGQIGV